MRGAASGRMASATWRARQGHQKVPQVGRVIIQDDVEIGANTTIDRGASRDTVIGEGTKIDNQVQVGHNVVIGRHCIIVAQTGLSGSTTLGDHVVLGARVGTNNHVTIGEGAQIAAISIVNDDVPAGRAMGRNACQAGQALVSRNEDARADGERPAQRQSGGTVRPGGRGVTVDETTKPATTSLDAQQILDLLPHRYPFLLVDRIEQICGDRVLRRHQERQLQ